MNKIVVAVFISLFLFMSACSTRGPGTYNGSHIKKHKRYRVKKKREQKKYYSQPTMKPYVVRGIKYYPTVVSVGDTFQGNASWYGPSFHGKLTASGEIYNMHAMTAAHKTLPMNTIVKVTNLRNGLSTVVRINDRGPFVSTRIIDLSNKAARAIKMIGSGTAPVKLEVLGFERRGKRSISTKEELRKAPQQQQMHNFALQIGSFVNIHGALITQEKYDNMDGYKTAIKDVQTEEGRMFKVVLKGFKSEQEARDYKESGIFKNAFIVKED